LGERSQRQTVSGTAEEVTSSARSEFTTLPKTGLSCSDVQIVKESGIVAETPAHLGGSWELADPYTFVDDIWGYLLVEYDIRSVVDIGCGRGYAVKWFAEQGCKSLGIEGDPVALADTKAPGLVIEHDYTKGPYVLPEPYDLAISMEFVEHVEEKFEPNWLETVKGCKWLLMSYAKIGQGGDHHVNENTEEHWIKSLESIGFCHYPVASSMFRGTCIRKPTPWGRNSLMFFGKDE
jgi:SAM-dependent methyltransferase